MLRIKIDCDLIVKLLSKSPLNENSIVEKPINFEFEIQSNNASKSNKY